MNAIRINFLPFIEQNFGITVYRKPIVNNQFTDGYDYYDFKNENGENFKYQIAYSEEEGFEAYELLPYQKTGIVSKQIYQNIIDASKGLGWFINKDNAYNRRIHYVIEPHHKGRKCVWIEPHFLKSKGLWGLLVGYQFVVSQDWIVNGKVKVDKEIQIASGSLNARGLSNTDFYLFKFNYIQKFINYYLPQINSKLQYEIDSSLLELTAKYLSAKEYIFHDGAVNKSPYLGLVKNKPYEALREDFQFHFIFQNVDRDYAVNLLKGLRGETYPNEFGGLRKLFDIPFDNDRIKGISIIAYTEALIDAEIKEIKDLGSSVLPVIIIDGKRGEEDDRLYYWLKHKFTQAGIPCQVVTKSLIETAGALKYSLSNIGLQIFAKAGGKPWKMKPAVDEYLIIGIGQSYKIETNPEGNSIEKNITYSVLTDSSGIFKDIQVLSEGIESEDIYKDTLVRNIVSVINATNYNKVVVHVPFRISKEILQKVNRLIRTEVSLTVVVINNKTDYFGFDYNNNGLVPYESSYLQLAADEFLVWFEGLHVQNPRITRRYGNPLVIKFWYSNYSLKTDYSAKGALLQDCINLSGANWRGFKAKQLPVSIFYCQRIAEFLTKFQDYNLEHIEINNLKPWFL